MDEPVNGTAAAAAAQPAGKPKHRRRRTLRDVDKSLDALASQITKQIVEIHERLGDLQELTQERRIKDLAVAAVDHKMAEYAKTHADAVAVLNALVEAGAITRAQLNAAVAESRARKSTDG